MIVTSDEASLRPDDGPANRARAPSSVRVASLSPDGGTVAFGSAQGIEFAQAAAPGEIVRRCPTPGPVDRIVWRDDGDYIAAACGAAGLALVDLRDGRIGRVDGFPAPLRSIAFSGPSNALVASGAYQIAAWDLERPPFDGDRSGALETGRTGMVAVVEVAAHPKRRLVAAAYANGKVVIAEPGRRDEMILKASGATPAALAWSADGRMLAIARDTRCAGDLAGRPFQVERAMRRTDMHAEPQPMTDEQDRNDRFFERLGRIADEMSAGPRERLRDGRAPAGGPLAGREQGRRCAHGAETAMETRRS